MTNFSQQSNNLCMKGTVRSRDKCEVCKGTFSSIKHPITKDIIDLMCESCKTRPRYFFIDARDFKAGKIYKDKRGHKYDSFLMASRQLEKMRSEFDEGSFDSADYIAAKLQEYKITQMVDLWIEKIKIDKSSSYVRHVRSEIDQHVIPFFKEKKVEDIRDIRSSHIDDLYYKLIAKTLQPKTVKNVLVNFKTFLKRLHNLEIIQRMPVFPEVKVPEKARGWINREKQELIMSKIPVKHHLIFETLMETAERPGEVCAHKKKDLLDGEICIERAFDERGRTKTSKTGKVIYRGISLQLWNKLQEHSKGSLPEAWLFLDEWNKPYSQDRLYRIWRRAAEAAKIDISLYNGTRHSRASQKRLEKEKEIAEACRKELGHASAATTMKHYARSRREEILT